MSNRALDEDDTPDRGCPPQIQGHARPVRPGIFRRRMILQLTSLLDLMLIMVFVQYLEMHHIANHAIAREAARRREAEAAKAQAVEQRDVLLSERGHNLYEVWYVHINDNKSVYPDGSVLVSSAGRKRVFQPRDADDFEQQLADGMKGGPRPQGPVVLLLTYENPRQATLDEVKAELAAAATDRRLQSAWGADPVRFLVVDGGISNGNP